MLYVYDEFGVAECFVSCRWICQLTGWFQCLYAVYDIRVYLLLLLLLTLFGSCAVSESNNFDKHFITFHCCSSLLMLKKIKMVAVLCCPVTWCCF